MRCDRAVVTGGAGFIGSHLVEALLSRGLYVTAIDDLSSGERENLPVNERFTFIEGTILDESKISEAVSKADVVFHLAADVSVQHGEERPLSIFETNAEGTLCVLEAARRAGIRRFIYSSSAARYGEGAALPIKETDIALPISVYGVSKLVGEQLVSAYSRRFGMDTVSLVYFNVFGPRQRHDSPYAAVVPSFLRRAIRGEPLVVYGDGTQTRDFVFVKDVVEANLLALSAKGLNGAIINCASGRETSLLVLISEIEATLGCVADVRFEAARPGDIKRSVADASKARKMLGFCARTSLRAGLKATAESLIR